MPRGYYTDSTALEIKLTEAFKSNTIWLGRKIFLGLSGMDSFKEICRSLTFSTDLPKKSGWIC